MVSKKSRKNRKSMKYKNKISRKKRQRGGNLPASCKKATKPVICRYCQGKGVNDEQCKCCAGSPQAEEALRKAEQDKQEGLKNLRLWADQAPCDQITQGKVDEFKTWAETNSLDTSVVDPLQNRFDACNSQNQQAQQQKPKKPKRKPPPTPDSPNFCEYCESKSYNSPDCDKCKPSVAPVAGTTVRNASPTKNKAFCKYCKSTNYSDPKCKEKCEEYKEIVNAEEAKKQEEEAKKQEEEAKKQEEEAKKQEEEAKKQEEESKKQEELEKGKKALEKWNQEERCEVINEKMIYTWKKWLNKYGLSKDLMDPLVKKFEKCKKKRIFINNLNAWSKVDCKNLSEEKVQEFDKWRQENELDDEIMNPLKEAFSKCKKKENIELFKYNLNKWAESDCSILNEAVLTDFEEWRVKNNLEEKLIEPLKKALDKCKFIERKKAEGAAKRAERAAAAASSEEASGEDIANLMHDGTCEKHNDCPTDKPKCLNNKCLTQADFTAAKRAEGAAKRAERAAAAASSEEASGEGIANLMHDGTCEKHKDCPSDKPKCLNNKCLTQADFTAAKRAEGAAKRAERAAAAASSEEASGEGIANLMHDGTCEKHNDCPSDKPKCLNNKCLTQADFTAAKRAEGAAKRAERAAASSEEASGEGIANLMHDGTCEKHKDCPSDKPKCLNNKCLTQADFTAAKRAEGAAKRAERAAAAASSEEASGEGIANLMHDGTCEKHNDCPSDKPKCLNNKCLTQADFTAAKRAEGAAKRAERAAAVNKQNITGDDYNNLFGVSSLFDKYMSGLNTYIESKPDNDKVKKFVYATETITA